jgi:prepilin-type N-terminal cleavage/methylation domain-containing protein
MRQRLWSDDGFGLVELLIAMTVLLVAVAALVAAIGSAHAAVLRAAKKSTAAALASSQIEMYRALRYHEIRLNPTRLDEAAADPDNGYASDDSYTAAQVAPTSDSPCVVPDPDAQHHCNASSRPQGADGRFYRVNTYIVYIDPADGREFKRVTVVIRDPAKGNRVLARQSTAFDELTGR